MTASTFGAAPKLVSSIELTVPTLLGDQTFQIQSPKADVALRYITMVNLGVSAASGVDVSEDPRLARLALDDDQEKTFTEEMLQDTLQAMLDAEVPYPYIQHASMTTLLWIWRGVDTAQAYWRGEEIPKAGPQPRGPQDRKPRTSPRTKRIR
ncbi:DUF7426 family protein [Tessaracoccus sp.]